jgi:hypothetical protein
MTGKYGWRITRVSYGALVEEKTVKKHPQDKEYKSVRRKPCHQGDSARYVGLPPHYYSSRALAVLLTCIVEADRADVCVNLHLKPTGLTFSRESEGHPLGCLLYFLC